MRKIVLITLLWALHTTAYSQDVTKDPTFKALIESVKGNEEPRVTYAALAQKADLIVIATVVEKKKVESGILGATDFDRESVRRISNRLRILSTMKGECNKEIEMITTEWGPNALIIGIRTNFAVLRTRLLLPNLSAVEVDGEITDWGIMDGIDKATIVPEYLIYLNRSSRDNTYVPVTGQRWAGTSVRLLND